MAVTDNAVERELLAGANDHQRAGIDAVDVLQPLTGAVANQDFGRRQIDQLADGLARAIETLRFEPLRGGEERHDHRRLFVFADEHGADDCDDHQDVDVQRAAPHRLPGALRGKYRADYGGGNQEGVNPPRGLEQHTDAAADDRQQRGNCSEPAAHTSAGRLRGLALAVATPELGGAALFRMSGGVPPKRLVAKADHRADLARRGFDAACDPSSSTCCRVCLKIEMMCWSSSE